MSKKNPVNMLSLSGVNPTIPHHDDFKLTKCLTLESWIKVNALSMACTILCYVDPDNDTPYGMYLDPQGRLYAQLGGVQTAGIPADQTVPRGVWTHVAAVYDGKKMRLYQDGVEVGSLAKNGGIDTNPDVPVWIGDNPPDAGSRPFYGTIDDVQIFDRALEPADVAELAKP